MSIDNVLIIVAVSLFLLLMVLIASFSVIIDSEQLLGLKSFFNKEYALKKYIRERTGLDCGCIVGRMSIVQEITQANENLVAGCLQTSADIIRDFNGITCKLTKIPFIFRDVAIGDDNKDLQLVHKYLSSDVYE